MWAILVAHCGQNWGFWTLLTEIPTYMSKVLNFDIKSVSNAIRYIRRSIPSHFLYFIGIGAALKESKTYLVLSAMSHVLQYFKLMQHYLKLLSSKFALPSGLSSSFTTLAQYDEDLYADHRLLIYQVIN